MRFKIDVGSSGRIIMDVCHFFVFVFKPEESSILIASHSRVHEIKGTLQSLRGVWRGALNYSSALMDITSREEGGTNYN